MRRPLPALISLLLASPLTAAAAPQQWNTGLVATLQTTPAQSGDAFGSSSAIEGDLAVVGAPLDDTGVGVDAGTAALFGRNQGGPEAWGLITKLKSANPSAGEYFGYRVDVSGDTVTVASHNFGAFVTGAVYVFERNAGGPEAWGHTATLVSSNPGSTSFGSGVAIDGDTIVVGALRDGPAGEAVVFERNQGGPGAWGETVTLASPSWVQFGNAVDIEGDRIAVGADGTNGPGAVYVYDRNLGGPGAWGLDGTLEPGTNNLPYGQVGESVRLQGDRLLTGAWNAIVGNVTFAGAVFEFHRDQGGPGAWGLVGVIEPPVPESHAYFGQEVAFLGELALFAAPGANKCYLYRDVSGTGSWILAKQITGIAGAGSVALGPARMVLGAPGAATGGRAYVHEHFAMTTSYCTAGVSASGCQATLSKAGRASATETSGFDLMATGVEGAKDGLFFYGTNGRQANAWGNGTSFQCVTPPVIRAGLLTGNGTAGICDGAFSQDLNALWCATCPKPTKNPGVAAIVQAQLWYRDPSNTSNQTTSLSDALEFFVHP